MLLGFGGGLAPPELTVDDIWGLSDVALRGKVTKSREGLVILLGTVLEGVCPMGSCLLLCLFSWLLLVLTGSQLGSLQNQEPKQFFS